MEAIRNSSDYVLWLQGTFDMIGERMPTEAEWKMLRERHALMAGEVVLQRMEERELAAAEKRRREQELALFGLQKPMYPNAAMAAAAAGSTVTFTSP